MVDRAVPIIFYGGFHLSDHIERVRALMDEHMTPTAPLYQALDALLAEHATMRRGMEALTERLEAVEDALEDQEVAS